MNNPVPEGWEVKPVSDVTHNFDARRVPLKSTDRTERQGPYRYYGASGVIDHVDDYIFEGDYILLGEDGENVLSRNLPLAFIVSGKFWVNNHAHVMQPKNGVDIGYLTEYLESLDYTDIASGSAQPKITQGSLSKIKVVIPPLPEQQKIAAILTSVDNVIESTSAQINKLQDLKTGMMQELLTRGIGHSEFKDSPVGRIPAGWDFSTISDCVTRFYQGINTVADKVQYVEEGVEILQAKHMTSGAVHWDGAKRIGPHDYEKYKDKFNPKQNDILFSNIGTIGKSVLVTIDKQFLIAWNVFLIRVQKNVTPKFMSYYLQRLDQLNFYDDLASGNATKFVNKTALGAIPVPVPCPEEQDRIVNALQSLDDRLSAGTNKLGQAISLKKALMQDLLTGKVRVKTD